MRVALALRYAPQRVCGVVAVSLGVFLLALCSCAAAGADISVESLQISIVEGTSAVDRSTLDFDQAIVGDTVRVNALVSNQDIEAVGEFEVDFFFTETISGEHGRLGTQVVSGLEPGESKRPIIAFDTSALSPGIYAFSAEADPRGALGDEDLCDNSAPRGPCGEQTAEDAAKYSLTLLLEGRHISQLRLSGAFPVCRMGALQTRLTVQVHNVGTETLTGGDLVVYGYYRLSLTPPANEFVPLAVDGGKAAPLSKVVSLKGPGSSGSITITLDYGAFLTAFAPSSTERASGEVLGHSDPAQIRITVQAADGSGVPQDIFLPEQFELSQFYSTVDLWTFPQRASCCVEDCATVTSAPVEPAAAGGLVFHVARTPISEVLYVLQARTGDVKGMWVAPAGKSLTSPIASYDDETGLYHIYVGASDGRIYALEGAYDEDSVFFLTDRWQSAATDIVKGDTYIALAADSPSALVAGSESGAFAVDTATGQTLRKVTNHAPVTAMPIYSAASQEMWLVADQAVYRVPATGSESTFDANEQITTRLLRNATGTALFFGTETGFIYAIHPTTCASLSSERRLRAVVGLSLVSSDDDAVLFATGEIGEAERVEYDHGRGFRDYSVLAREIELNSIAADPAVYANASEDDALAVFTAGHIREGRATRPILVAWDKDLEDYVSVSVWGASVPFVFKPEEGGVASAAELLRPVVDPVTQTLFVVSSDDGMLYAFDISEL